MSNNSINSIIVLLICFIVACNNTKKKKYYYSTGELLSEITYNNKGIKDGELKQYYKSGELKAIEYYDQGKIVDTTKRFSKNGSLIAQEYQLNGHNIYEKYYENGNLMSKGKVIDTLLTGWWEYYHKDGKPKMKVEYMDVSKDSLIKNPLYTNQLIYYDQYGKVLKDSSNYFTIDLKDTILREKISIGYLDLQPSVSKKDDFHMVYYWQEDEQGNTTNVDSTYGKNEKKAMLRIIPKIIGQYKLKGYVHEKGRSVRVNKEDSTMADITFKERKLFFEKPFVVVDSVNAISK
ncbi:hypothetical protein J8281_14820 [Aquimarina sp. U1-2]|uniref:toxin-antitoxin system YwqK family antitoxin n=1 Tax=Aquimarina sp. U1-2 TaxID=2823141 RepID=UPI001AED0C6A|nr:hypothetical protein [Aquimarina sp. U1-2]MBP2833466.1 hypothetical protein [Aquimarina sp. U1-2]